MMASSEFSLGLIFVIVRTELGFDVSCHGHREEPDPLWSVCLSVCLVTSTFFMRGEGSNIYCKRWVPWLAPLPK
uniref:Secreted protein n=1 Tax=Zea mays TaxID=4577 RepID=C4J256_MAIZE|nr:unknown [Zea mays]